MSPSESGASWINLLEEKKQEIEDSLGQGRAIRSEISTKSDFRSALERFCKKRREYRPSRLEASIFPSLTPIVSLAKAVTQSSQDLEQLAPEDSLEGLIWSLSFAVVEYGHEAGVALEPLISSVASLNRKVPELSSGVGPYRLRFPDERRVQEPLQQVYTLFVDAQLFFLSYVREKDHKRGQDLMKDSAIKTHINDTTSLFEGARGRYNVLVTQVAEDREREQTKADFIQQHSSSSPGIQAHFVFRKRLGRGSYGQVDEVYEVSTQASYARKNIHLDPDKSPETRTKEVVNEVTVMQKLRHMHIATVLFYLKEDETYSIFMLPVAEYHLGSFLDKCAEQDFPAGMTKNIYPWFGCLLDALAYAHKIKIKHQDIKPSNILIKNDQPYLCDFGLAKDYTDADTSKSGGAAAIGSRHYHAPEILSKQVRGSSADVFALGCVYSEMLTVCRGKSPEEYRNARRGRGGGGAVFGECLETVREWVVGFKGKSIDRLHGLLVEVILGMLNEDPEDRLTSERALNILKCERALFCVE